MAEKENSEVGWQKNLSPDLYAVDYGLWMFVVGIAMVYESFHGANISQLKPGGHHLGWECPSSMEDGAITSNHLPYGYLT